MRKGSNTDISPFSYDWAGAIHVHSVYSDGTGTFSEIVDAAVKAELDFLIFNDHGSHRLYEKGAEGYYGKTLVLIGQEIGRRMGHCLAIGTTEKIDDPTGDIPEIVRKIKKQNGIPILAHPEGRGKVIFAAHDNSWKDRTQVNFTGMEVWSFMYDWIEDLNWFNGPYYYLHPECVLRGPRDDVLQLWDRLCQQRPVVGIGGLDAHAKQMFGMTAFPYEFLFRTLRTHVLTEPPTGNFHHDRNLLLDGIRGGHVYFSNDFHLSASGFSFEAAGDEKIHIQGDSLHNIGTTILKTSLPYEATVRIIRNGKVMDSRDCISWEMPLNEAGVYRVEVVKEEKKWIFSNPVYIHS